VREVAEAAKVSPDTVVRLERGEALRERTVDAIRAALEAAGVEFIAENGGGPGVRLAKAKRGEPDGVQGGIDTPSSNPPIDEDAT
jgi:transcriptional regulator with XRE-family HTH domain